MLQKLVEMLNGNQISFDDLYTLIVHTKDFQITFQFGKILIQQKTRYAHAHAHSVFSNCVLILIQLIQILGIIVELH